MCPNAKLFNKSNFLNLPGNYHALPENGSSSKPGFSLGSGFSGSAGSLASSSGSGSWTASLEIFDPASTDFSFVRIGEESILDNKILLSFMALDKKITRVSVFRSPLHLLSKLKRSLRWLFHAFLVLETADGEYFSLEKGAEAVTIQKSNSREVLLAKSRGLQRPLPVRLVKDATSDSTFRQVIQILVERDVLTTPYNLIKENCKWCAKVVFDGVADDGEELSVGPVGCDLPHPTNERGETTSGESDEDSSDEDSSDDDDASKME
jgi:hypothetical protein